MIIDSAQQEILNDLDRLSISYQIKIYSVKKEDWQPYFHQLSLDSHQHNQLFLAHNRLFSENKQVSLNNQSLLLSGLALSKKKSIKAIHLVSNHDCFSATIGCPSHGLGKKLPNIKNSSHARWKCIVNLSSGQEKEHLELIITFDDEQKISFKTIEFALGKLSQQPKKINHKISNDLACKVESIYNSRLQMERNILQGKNYLFAIGNPRSGTTALGKLLNSSPEICLGIERYSLDENVSASSFTKESFFDAKSANYLVRPHLYEEIKPKFDQAKYIGDKRPRFVKFWRNTWLNLPKAKIVYIFRNIYDVACSYNTRANNAALGIDQSWSSARDFSKAVKDWNEGLQEVRNLAQFYTVYFVKYEDFFVEQLKMLHLFDYLQVNTAESGVQKGMNQVRQGALSLKDKPRILSDLEIKYIDEHADLESYNYLLGLYEKQFKAQKV
ncbi:MAG: hypothetical protein RLZZ04_2439 [Cyanobacteriota bacterium]|jgi:hypothetical protein